jgi:CDP-diacylglycerol--glycerol-3-phosphate 3-phosphatidyltransferase
MTRAGRAGGAVGGGPPRKLGAGEETATGPARGVLNGPTILTILRMIFSVLFMTFALIPDVWSKIVALIIFIIASITDKIDGAWARKKKLVTDLGAFLDPLADKMLTGLAFLVLTYQNVIPIWVFAIILVRDFAVDGMRMMVARTGKTVPASFYGKLKTTLQMIALIIILLNQILNFEPLNIIGNIVLYASLVLCIASGFDYLTKGWKQVAKPKR